MAQYKKTAHSFYFSKGQNNASRLFSLFSIFNETIFKIKQNIDIYLNNFQFVIYPWWHLMPSLRKRHKIFYDKA